MPTKYNAGQPLVATQRFGFERTDIACFQSSADLVVISVDGLGVWHGPLPLTGQSFGVENGSVAASEQVATATPQTDLFTVDGFGRLTVFWSLGPAASWKSLAISQKAAAIPGGGLAVAPQYLLESAQPYQTDVFLVDPSGALVVYYVVGGGEWAPAERLSLPGLFPAGARRRRLSAVTRSGWTADECLLGRQQRRVEYLLGVRADCMAKQEDQ